MLVRARSTRWIAATTAATMLALAACDVEQTEEGDMPDVDVESGELPEYDVDAADVDVRTEERTVEVPVVDVDPAEAGEAEPAEAE